MHSLLPDYDDFRGYDLCIDEQLEQIAALIFANLHKPSRKALKHHLFTAEVPRGIFRKIKILAEIGKSMNLRKNGCSEG